MTTATERLFAIPELLEQVLLYVYETEIAVYLWRPMWHGCVIEDEEEEEEEPDRLDLMRGVTRLFVLQRVNKSFESTILGSGRLRRRMGLEYAHSKELYPDSDRGVLSCWFYLLDERLQTFDTFDSNEHILRVSLVLPIYGSFPARSPINSAPSSWHKIKITITELPVQVRINVRLRLQIGDSIISIQTYEESREFHAGEGTLGDIEELIYYLHSRSVAKHWLLANGQKLRRLTLYTGVAVATALVLSILGINLHVEVRRGVAELCNIFHGIDNIFHWIDNIFDRIDNIFDGIAMKAAAVDSSTFFIFVIAATFHATIMRDGRLMLMVVLAMAAWVSVA